MGIWQERFENVGSVLGRHPGRGYTGSQRRPTLIDALPSGHPFNRIIRHAGIRWAYSTPHLQGQIFLKDNQNENELFQFISQELQRYTADSRFQLLTTKADFVLSNQPADLTAVSPCKQEEADTRMMLHLPHAAEQGHTKAYLRTVDSDMVVLAINLFHALGLSELWIGFRSGKTY